MFFHLALEQAAGVRVGEHHRRHIRPELGLERGEIDAAIIRAGHFIDGKTRRDSSRGIGAVRGGRHKHALALIRFAARGERGLDRQHAAKLAVRASLGRERHRRHAGQFHQPVREFIHQFERALHGGNRLQRMQIGKTFQARDALVQARIVLHCTRAQRKEAKIDGVILLRETHIMAHGFRLGQSRQIERGFARKAAKLICACVLARADRRRFPSRVRFQRSAARLA